MPIYFVFDQFFFLFAFFAVAAAVGRRLLLLLSFWLFQSLFAVFWLLSPFFGCRLSCCIVPKYRAIFFRLSCTLVTCSRSMRCGGDDQFFDCSISDTNYISLIEFFGVEHLFRYFFLNSRSVAISIYLQALLTFFSFSSLSVSCRGFLITSPALIYSLFFLFFYF